MKRKQHRSRSTTAQVECVRIRRAATASVWTQVEIRSSRDVRKRRGTSGSVHSTYRSDSPDRQGFPYRREKPQGPPGLFLLQQSDGRRTKPQVRLQATP